MSALLGIDVSNIGQGNVDWSRAGAGLAFGLAKASEGVSFTDPSFGHNLSGMRAERVLPGAYHFLRGGVSGAAQCDHFLAVVGNAIAGNAGRMLLALDVEVAGAGSAVEEFVHRFAQRLPHRTLLIYSNAGLWSLASGPTPVTGAPVQAWHAGYVNDRYTPLQGSLAGQWAGTAAGTRPSLFGGMPAARLIQFTDHAQVPGVSGTCDGNAWLGTVAELQALAGAAAPAPAPRSLGGSMFLVTEHETGRCWDLCGLGMKDYIEDVEVIAAYLKANPALNGVLPVVPSAALSNYAAVPNWLKSATAPVPPPATAVVDVAALEAQLAADLEAHLPALQAAAIATQVLVQLRAALPAQ